MIINKAPINIIINMKLIFKFKEILNISLEAIDVIYINKINIPPKKIRNNEYENQKDLVNSPVNKAIVIVWIINIIPIERGWFIIVNEILVIIKNIIIKFCIIYFRK